jgi:O-antigen/teichoic acid export membrane protein
LPSSERPTGSVYFPPVLDRLAEPVSNGNGKMMQERKEAFLRMLKGVGATFTNYGVTIFIQLVQVPVFLWAWGVKGYGEWLLVSCVPGYLALADMGFGNAAASEMTIETARGNYKKAQELFQSTAWFLLVVGGMITLLSAGAAVFLPLKDWLKMRELSSSSLSLILGAFGVYTTVGFFGSVLAAGFQAGGAYGEGGLLFTFLRLTEFVGAVVAAALGFGFVGATLAMAFVRAAGSWWIAALLWKKCPWLRLQSFSLKPEIIRKLWAPGSAFLLFPTGHAASIQGMNMAIGTLCGPKALVLFSTLRTMTRMVFQLVAALAHVAWPEVSMAWGKQDLPFLRRLHRGSVGAAILLVLSLGSLLMLAGGPMITFWTHNKIPMDHSLFFWLLLDAFFACLWISSSVLLMGLQAHVRLAWFFAVSQVVFLGAAVFLMPSFGLLSAALCLVLADCAIAGFCFLEVARMLQVSFAGLLLEVASPRCLITDCQRLLGVTRRWLFPATKKFLKRPPEEIVLP